MDINLDDLKDCLSKTSFLVNLYKINNGDDQNVCRVCDTLIQHMALTLLKKVEWDDFVKENGISSLVSTKTDTNIV